MSGLLQRALAYIQSQAELSRLEAPALDSDQDIAPEERKQVESQINEILAGNRITVTADTLRFTPKARGGALPLLVNVVAACVLIGGVAAAVLVFRRQEQTIVSAPAALATAEGMLMQAQREEFQRELSQKQQEIEDIQRRLRQAGEDKARLQEQTDAQLKDRERELRGAMERELEAERSRLRGAGLSEERIAVELGQLEEAQRRSLETELADLRRDAEARLVREAERVDRLIGEYEQSLGRAQDERLVLERDLASRQAEMEARFREQESALRTDRSQALQQLEQLRQQQESEQLVRDQFLSYYTRTRDHLGERRFSQALAVLQEFRGYLEEPSVSSIPGIRRRRPVELFLIGSLERLITQQRDSAELDTASLLASAGLISRVSETVARADRLFGDREYLQARELYLSALAEIPAVRVGHGRLQEIEQLFARRRDEEVAALISTGGDAYRRGDYPAAVTEYRRALTLLHGERGVAEEMIARIMEAGYRIESARAPAPAQTEELQARLEASELAGRRRAEELEAARRRIAELEAAGRLSGQRLAELETAGLQARQRLEELEAARRERENTAEELAWIRRQYLSLAAQREAFDGEARSELVALLETKVLIQQVLVSEPVRTQYPELYDRFEVYLDALVQDGTRDTRAAVLRDLDTLLDGLIRRQAGPARAEALRPYASDPSTPAFVQVLDKLELLLR